MQRRMLLASVLVGVLSAGLLVFGQNQGQPPGEAAGSAVPPGVTRMRLPPYFAAVVSATQREEIYRLQRSHLERIDALRRQLLALEMERDKAVDGVLTPDQLAQIQQRRAEAAERRRARGRPAVEPEGPEQPEGPPSER